MSTCLIGIGANLGNRAETIRSATRRLAEHAATESLFLSKLHETTPVGGPAPQPNFLNSAARLDTSLDPSALLDLLQAIEHQCGRQRHEHWAARTLDLDLLLCDDEVIDGDRLTVPHPRMAFRRFVLQPAAEVGADLQHARMGWTIRQLLDHLDASMPYLAIGGGDAQLRRRLAEEVVSRLGARHLREPSRAAQPIAAGPTATIALKSLQAEARALAQASWPGDKQLTVSEFWLDGWSVVAPTLSGGRVLSQAWQSLRGDVVTPRLTVVVDDPRTSDDQRAAQSRAIREYAERPTLGPLLWVPADDWTGAVAETVAACQAMQ